MPPLGNDSYPTSMPLLDEDDASQGGRTAGLGAAKTQQPSARVADYSAPDAEPRQR